jgi:glycosyltransferase involved in cell wall biosynthesis
MYAAYWDCPVLTHFVTAFSLALIAWRLRKRVVSTVFWNAMTHYVLALLVVRFAHIRCILDLEDGPRDDLRNFRGAIERFLVRVWDRWADAAMVANAQLLDRIQTRPAYVYYGVAPAVSIDRDWNGQIRFFFSGYLSKETGVEVLIDALHGLKERSSEILSHFRVLAVGYGKLTDRMRSAADGELRGILEFHGLASDAEYQELLRTSHVGLCLKMPDHAYGQTTFPSKVIEFARWGLLVVSSKVSDVPALFSEDSAVLLDETAADQLAAAIKKIIEDPSGSQSLARTGQRVIASRLDPGIVAWNLARLWLGPALNSDTRPGDAAVDAHVSVSAAERT